jgi:hypothetical protein
MDDIKSMDKGSAKMLVTLGPTTNKKHLQQHGCQQQHEQGKEHYANNSIGPTTNKKHLQNHGCHAATACT